MQFLDFLIALLRALFWGSVVLINVFVGGGPYNQIRGTTLGALIVGLGLLITGFAKFNNPTVIIVGLISGALWAFGGANQLKSISLIGVSNTMPVSTGMQLVGTTLFSVIFLGEWSSMTQIIFGLIAMILLVTG
ncbi:glucose transporter, partial [Escherichia coli]|nr:glucose transporter [Escherichia coli]